MLGNVTEAQADKAVRTLKRAIDAAENSNQAGENFVVAAAAAEDLLKSLIQLVELLESYDLAGGPNGWVAQARTAIAKATGGVTMLVNNEQMRGKISADPDLETEAAKATGGAA